MDHLACAFVMLSVHMNLTQTTEIQVGLESDSYSTMEGKTVRVCAVLREGHIDRDVLITFEAEAGGPNPANSGVRVCL